MKHTARQIATLRETRISPPLPITPLRLFHPISLTLQVILSHLVSSVMQVQPLPLRLPHPATLTSVPRSVLIPYC